MLPDTMIRLQYRSKCAHAMHVKSVVHSNKGHSRSAIKVIAAMSADAACKYEAKPPFNFGVTTDEETGVCGSARPGAVQQRCYTEDLRVTPDEVQEWVSFMKHAGVQSVVSMLSESELATYAEPLPAAMEAAFGQGNYVNVDAKAAGGQAKTLSAVKAARDAGKKVVVHCWGGGGRTGLVQAAWLVSSKGLTPQQAADAVTAYASSKGLSRRVDVQALTALMADSKS